MTWPRKSNGLLVVSRRCDSWTIALAAAWSADPGPVFPLHRVEPGRAARLKEHPAPLPHGPYAPLLTPDVAFARYANEAQRQFTTCPEAIWLIQLRPNDDQLNCVRCLPK